MSHHKPSHDGRTVTLSQIVRRAADIVDPDDEDASVGDFEQAFEDADEPASAVLTGLDERIGRVIGGNDENAALALAGAITLYLAHRRDELGGDPDEILRLTARAEWDGEPPEPVRELLEARGVAF